jgi:uncharacterized repeat protein (TIGR03803 family)
MGNRFLSGMARAGSVASIALLAACGGGDSSDVYSVGGTATGLDSGSAVVLQLNGAATTTISANGRFTFSSPLQGNVDYSVTVLTEPAGQVCNLDSASGKFPGSDVTGVTLSCYATFKVLYSFSGGADGRNGAYPTAGLIQGADGAFYGTTQANAATGQNATVFRVTPAGEMTVLYNFPAPTQGYYSVSSLVQGTDGNFYGTTSALHPGTGDSGLGGIYGTVFSVTPSGVFTLLHIFGASQFDGLDPEAELIQANDGNFYGTTVAGGTAAFGTVFRITPTGAETVVFSFPSGPSGPIPLGALLQGADGNFYCIDPTAAGLYRIGTDGTATVFATFKEPNTPVGTLLQDSSGNIFGVAQAAPGEIFQVTSSGEVSAVYSFAEELGTISGLRLASDGSFYGTTSYIPSIEFHGQTFANVNGTLFTVTPAGAETTLYAFGNSTISPLAQASDGHYYAVSEFDGTYGLGAVIQF